MELALIFQMFFEAMFMTEEEAIIQSENKASNADAFSDEKY